MAAAYSSCMSSVIPLRAIAARFSAPFIREALEQVLEAHPFEFCADIFGGTGYRPLRGLPPDAQQYFQSAEIRNAYYAGVDWNALVPLDEEVIMKMRECEAVFMSVVTRLEGKRAIPYMTRKLWYLRHLQFWNDYLTRHRINLYLSAWIPHELPDIVIYHLCKARGIPTLYFDITVFRDTSVAGHDVRHAGYKIEQRYSELLAEYGDADPEKIPLKEPFGSYERALLSAAGKPPPLESFQFLTYWDHVRRLLVQRPVAFATFALQFLTPAGWSRAWWAVIRSWVSRRTRKFYDAHTTVPDLRKKFVYFPLHYQPEATTMPMGGVYADQILVARMLNAALPDDVFIYVKEHPHRSNWLSRSVSYYKDFLELSKVRLVPTHFDTFILREHCSAVTTITGSAGLEALFRGKPVLLFGSCYYQYAGGVFPIHTLKDCTDAVHAIFEREEVPTRKSTHLYLKAIEEAAVPGVPDPWYLHISKLSAAEHTRVMAEAIVKEVEGMKPEIEKVSA